MPGGLQKGLTDELNLKTPMPVLGQAAGANLDSAVLPSINANFDFPLRLYASAVPDAFLNLSASTTTMGDGGVKASAPINGVGPAAYAAGKINMGTGALTGLGTTTLNGATFATAFAALTKTNGQFRRFVFCQQQDGSMNVISSAEAASQAALTDYGSLSSQGGGSFIGHVDVIWVSASTQYKTPAASGNTIGDDGIFRQGGSGGGGGSASAGLALQSASTPNVTFTSGAFPLEDGRELLSSDGAGTDTTNYGKALTVSATSVLAASPAVLGGGGSPAASTVYYFYIDLDTIAIATIATGSQAGRQIYPITAANFIISTFSPWSGSINRSRYEYRGQIKTTSGSAWSGTGAVLVAAATLQGNNLPVAVNPVVYRRGKQVLGVVGSSGQTIAGHIFSSKSWPTALVQASQVAWWNLIANGNDNGPQGVNLTNNGATFTGSNIFGTASAAAVFNGSSQFFSSSNAYLNPTGKSFAGGAWVNCSSFAGSPTIMSQGSGTGDRSWIFGTDSVGHPVFFATGSAGAWDLIFTCNALIPTNILTKVDFVYNFASGVVIVYINDEEVGRGSISTIRASTTPSFFIGKDFSGDFFPGTMHDGYLVAGYLMSDTDIKKLYCSRLDHGASVQTAFQEWTGNVYTDTELAKHLPVSGPSGALIDCTDPNSAFFDFSNYNGVLDSVELALKDTSLSPAVVAPVPPYDVIFTVTPTANTTAPHNQPDVGEPVLMVETGVANQWAWVSPEGKVAIDATNITFLDGFPTASAQPNRVSLVVRAKRLASVGVPQATSSRLGTVYLGSMTGFSKIVGTGSGAQFGNMTTASLTAGDSVLINSNITEPADFSIPAGVSVFQAPNTTVTFTTATSGVRFTGARSRWIGMDITMPATGGATSGVSIEAADCYVQGRIFWQSTGTLAAAVNILTAGFRALSIISVQNPSGAVTALVADASTFPGQPIVVGG